MSHGGLAAYLPAFPARPGWRGVAWSLVVQLLWLVAGVLEIRRDTLRKIKMMTRRAVCG